MKTIEEKGPPAATGGRNLNFARPELNAADPLGQAIRHAAELAVPPYSERDEKAALGCILLAADTAEDAAGAERVRVMVSKLSQEDFCTPLAREVWAAIVCLNLDRRVPRVLDVAEWLRRHDRLEAAGGVAAVADLPEQAAHLGVFDEHHERLKERRRLREILAVGCRITTLATREPMDSEARTAAIAEQCERLTGLATRGPASIGVDFNASILPAAELARLKIEAKPFLAEPFFREADLGFIHGPRGLGKTWLALTLAHSIASGTSPISWFTPPGRNPVLYIDGEMQLADIKSRSMSLSRGGNPLLFVLSHQPLFEKTGRVFNLACSAQQEAITELCESNGIKALFLDNLSCLVSGVEENSADDWEAVLSWLLTLRRSGIAVVVISHSGRNGQMRGTSRREDAASWVLRLDESRSHACPGAKFVSTFTKNRNALDDVCPDLDWSFQTQPDGQVTIACQRLNDMDQFRQGLSDGFTRNGDLADALGWSRAKVSKMARKAVAAGWLEMNGRDYKLK